jgi:pimeloyl-ACP methyl ester carboxylesterase
VLEYVLGVGIPYDPLSAPYDVARAFFNAAGYVVSNGMVYKVEADSSTNLYTDPADPRRTGTNVPGLSSVSVDGHSLGGNLAMAFSRLFPGATDSVTAVNGLGFKIGDSNINNLFATLGVANDAYCVNERKVA